MSHRFIQTMMKKVFLQLIAELKRLGSKIVYANFNKVIICTSKTSVTDARAYMNFILNGIRKHEVIIKNFAIESTI